MGSPSAAACSRDGLPASRRACRRRKLARGWRGGCRPRRPRRRRGGGRAQWRGARPPPRGRTSAWRPGSLHRPRSARGRRRHCVRAGGRRARPPLLPRQSLQPRRTLRCRCCSPPRWHACPRHACPRRARVRVWVPCPRRARERGGARPRRARQSRAAVVRVAARARGTARATARPSRPRQASGAVRLYRPRLYESHRAYQIRPNYFRIYRTPATRPTRCRRRRACHRACHRAARCARRRTL
ncbi:hypothetical protein T492DRAFT_1105136 [Pavlovales sp. CCMP2436]|nr:hypothetical protein T492DRAFT_1105136 [Pavlovales sp. CCMP2436]